MNTTIPTCACIVCLGPEDYRVLVAGRLIGSWPCRRCAEMGLAVEQRRAEAQKEKEGA